MSLIPLDDRLQIAPLDSRKARARLLRICSLVAAVALVVGIFIAADLVAEAAEMEEAPLSSQTVEVLPQQLSSPTAAAESSGDRWPWAIVAGVLVTLAGGSYAVGRRRGSA